MSFINVFGLIIIMIVPTSEGASWAGTFTKKNTCDSTACCCPPDSLTITSATDGQIASTFTAKGNNCQATAMNLTGNGTDVDSITINGVGTFKINTQSELEVVVDQNTNGSCTLTMTRTSKPTQKPGTSGSGNPNPGGSTTSNPNGASSSHQSILIKFISIIMAVTIIYV